MNLDTWLKEEKLRPHKATPKEIASLFLVIERDIQDASVDALSEDRRFATVYNAGLQLATIVLYASGYRPYSGQGHHWITLSSLKDLWGPEAERRSSYLNRCRSKRNAMDYDRAYITSEQEVMELLSEVKAFREDVIAWLKGYYPELAIGI